MDDHIAGCAECQAQLERLSALDRLVKDHSQLRSDDPYFDSLAARTEERLFGKAGGDTSVTKVTPIPWWRWTAIAAGVVLTSVVSWRVYDEQPKVRELSTPSMPSDSVLSSPPLSDSLSLATIVDSAMVSSKSEEASPEVPDQSNEMNKSDASNASSTAVVPQSAKAEEVTAKKVIESKSRDRSETATNAVPDEKVSRPDQAVGKSTDLNRASSEVGRSSQIAKKPVAEPSNLAAPPVDSATAPPSATTSLTYDEELELLESKLLAAEKAAESAGESSGDASSPPAKDSPSPAAPLSTSLLKKVGVVAPDSKNDVIRGIGDRYQKTSLRGSAQSVDTLESKNVRELRRLLSKFRNEPDTVLQRLLRDSIQGYMVQHPPLPPDLIQQLDSLGFRR